MIKQCSNVHLSRCKSFWVFLGLSYGFSIFPNKRCRMAWYGMVDVCDGYLAAEAPGPSFG